MSNKLNKFIAPYETQVLEGTFPAIPQASFQQLSLNRSVPLDQVPPAQCGQLPAFQCVARGNSNVLATEKVSKGTCSLKAVWAKSQFGQAPEVLDIDPNILKETDETGNKVKIVRLQPDRFERGRVQRPKMTVEEVDVADLYGDDEKLIHPSKRRWAHDTAVNARLAAQALKEAHLTKSKLAQSCRVNYPHGVTGVEESPYGETGGVYTNSEAIKAESQKGNRKGRGGQTPSGTLGELLKGGDRASGSQPSTQPKASGGKRMYAGKTGTFSIKTMQ